MKIPLSKVDLLDEDRKRVDDVLRSGWIMQGPRVEEFEKSVATFCKTPLAIATSSGTTALHLALELLGIGAGDEVIVPSFSWIASANSIRYTGAIPVFCDVTLDTYNMNPKNVATLLSDRTKAMMVVHQFGMPCDMNALTILAEKHHIPIIEDAACAIGSRYGNEPIGSASRVRISCLSFHPRNVVNTAEGGMLLTRDTKLAEKARILRNHGMKIPPPADSFPILGYNYRMTDMQAALGIGQIERLGTTITRRRTLASLYHEHLAKFAGVLPPTEETKSFSNFQSYMIRLEGSLSKKRDVIVDKLAASGIASKKSIAPIHLQECYKGQPHTGPLPNTEQLATDGLILPLYASMSDGDIDFVCKTLKSSI